MDVIVTESSHEGKTMSELTSHKVNGLEEHLEKIREINEKYLEAVQQYSRCIGRMNEDLYAYRECLEVYADEDNWECEENASEYEPAVVWKTRQHGYTPAQECLAKYKGGDAK